ncbi:MAG: class I SAM-dependent methyltransferase, partial [Caulobacteraceae bacterium]
YAARPRLGADGDFITAPHVSQMFGELLGLWAVEAWRRMGAPPSVRLVELGPGDGTLMADALRAARVAADFEAAREVWLVETSGPLRARQEAALAGSAGRPRWVEDLAAVPADTPFIVLANEFLDCLPIRQYVRTPEGWMERRIGLDSAGNLDFQAARWPSTLASAPPAPIGSILEISDALAVFGETIGALIARAGGAALFMDYGRDGPDLGDTLQAVRRHRRESPLANPGEADLTAHVDFPVFLAAARAGGARATPIRCQRSFLTALGIEARAAVLAQASADRAALISRQFDRLIGADRMGTLFKAACVHSPDFDPPGFEAEV